MPPPLPNETPSNELPSGNLIDITIAQVILSLSLVLQISWVVLTVVIPYGISFIIAYLIPVSLGLLALKCFGQILKKDLETFIPTVTLVTLFVHIMLVIQGSQAAKDLTFWTTWFQPLFVSVLALSILVFGVFGFALGCYLALEAYRGVARRRASYASRATPSASVEKDDRV
ncbi:uncharacterized protein BDZ99DRAFT_479565 [Mytilinidion resinicola]|uniref:Uncharacterized protein n=1 Tax=Mytilinidion resinicola TaxID=574789 RepID=A0A6A6YCJ5_9PEZI|nr:uncharacterized protein BDZ99DRAFT_479565 [Mytilinidion resinicola]KAF2806298.1 hypothetical protein BDZ99DRAFT_479565 [Mytilinidion resinicola]